MASLTMIMGQSTTFNEDILGTYYPPKNEYDFEKDIRESNYTASIADLKRAFDIANNNIKVDNVEERDKSQYYDETGITFYGKDGTSDAYVKRGLDADIVSYFERQEVNQRTWRFSTSSSDIDFKGGGKIVIGNKEWVIIKVINQFSTNDIENQLKVRTNMNLLEYWGYKTFILA